MNLKETNLTPDQLPQDLFESDYFFLLETTLPDESNRWTIAGWSPSIVLSTDSDPNILEKLREPMKETSKNNDLPFCGGWIGYLGYEFYRYLEKKVPVRQSELIPEALFGFYENFYLYDHREGCAYLAGNAPFNLEPLHHRSPSYAKRGIPTHPSLNVREGPGVSYKAIESNLSKEDYLAAIHKIKNYITAGDCYQVNLSQRFSGPVDASPYEIYQQLKKISPAPYSAFLNIGSAQIISSSPESFLHLEGRTVTTRPIKGTRPRGTTNEEDARLREELLTSAKDRAELLMITDLLRNDLGRVCEKGSVKVPRLVQAESYAQVHHLVSTVEGKLCEDKDVVDLLKATFPGGSITGAPKIRSMEIIHELEPTPREIYTGVIGFMSLNGHAAFNIAIRTMIYKQSPPSLPSPLAGEGEPANRQVGEGEAYFWGGGGIVADSDPNQEYLETMVKVEGIKKATALY